MSLGKSIIKGSFVLSIGEFLSYGSSFIRNMIIARLLTKEDFGIAATFAMVLTILEFSGKMAIGRLVVQDPEGDSSDFIATAHTVMLVTGILSGLVIFFAAKPLVMLFDARASIWSYQLLAIIPMVQGAGHLEIARLEREFKFLPSTIVSAGPQVVTSLAAWPVALLIPTYNAVLFIIISKAVASTLLSHIISKTSYKLRINKVFLKRIYLFSWPLVINGFLLFVVFQGDQFIIASHYSMDKLASYAASFSIATVPTFIFFRIFPSIMLPVMSKAQNDQQLFCMRYKLVIELVCFFTVFYVVSIIIGSQVIMTMVFGSKFSGTGILLSWLTIAYAFRTIRFAPSIAALAKADSKTQMYSNSCRVATLFVSLILAIMQQPIWMIAATGVISEIAACTVSFFRLSKINLVPWSYSRKPVVVTLIFLLLASSYGVFFGKDSQSFVIVGIALLSGIISASLTLLFFPYLRSYLFKYVRKYNLNVSKVFNK